MNMGNPTDENLANLHKKLELLISQIFDEYKKLLTSEDVEEYEEYLVQGEYELAASSLLAGIKNKDIILDQENIKKIQKIYTLMDIPMPII